MKRLFGVFTLMLCIASCSTNEEEPQEVIEDKHDVTRNSVNVAINCWTYQQMHHHYLWNEELPDSASLNYEVDFVEFYKSILSVKDRFSYYEYNTSYKGSELASHVDSLFRNPVYETRGLLDTEDVLLDTIYQINQRRIGYINYTTFDSANVLYQPFKKFKENKITDLIVDLRYNGGGYLSTALKLGRMILPEESQNKEAIYLKYNKTVSQELYAETGKDYYTYYFTDDGMLTDEHVQQEKVYFIIGDKTASASECLIYSLKPYIDVVTIGYPSVGKGTGMYAIQDNKYKYKLIPITFRYYNSQWETIPDDGIKPDYQGPDDISIKKSEIGNIAEPLLKMALDLICK
jgi:hypothetical protein